MDAVKLQNYRSFLDRLGEGVAPARRKSRRRAPGFEKPRRSKWVRSVSRRRNSRARGRALPQGRARRRRPAGAAVRATMPRCASRSRRGAARQSVEPDSGWSADTRVTVPHTALARYTACIDGIIRAAPEPTTASGSSRSTTRSRGSWRCSSAARPRSSFTPNPRRSTSLRRRGDRDSDRGCAGRKGGGTSGHLRLRRRLSRGPRGAKRWSWRCASIADARGIMDTHASAT